MKIKKGDFVARKSYKKDILFIVDKVIQLSNEKSYVILKGVTIRIEADAPIEDVEKVEESRVIGAEERIEKTLLERIKNNKTEHRNHIIKTGKILHLDGDAHLSNKEKYSNTNTSEQVIFNHNKNNVSKIKIHYFFITKREEFCEREHI